MLNVDYCDSRRVLLIAGHGSEFEPVVLRTREFFAQSDERRTVHVQAQSVGETPVTEIVIRKGPVPNRISYESGIIVFAVAPTLCDAFLSFMDFAGCDQFLDAPIRTHHHYEYIGQYECIAPDSLPVVFSLKRREDSADKDLRGRLDEKTWMKQTIEESIIASLQRRIAREELLDEEWLQFKDKMRSGDELWCFRTPPETWTEFFPHCGLAGYALIRQDRVVAEVFTSMS